MKTKPITELNTTSTYRLKDVKGYKLLCDKNKKICS